MIIDVLFVFSVLALTPDGGIVKGAYIYQTPQQCRQARNMAINDLSKVVDKKELQIYISECTPVEMKEVK